jgi:hypothetical protein
MIVGGAREPHLPATFVHMSPATVEGTRARRLVYGA